MNILIKGMEMPEDETFVICLYSNGRTSLCGQNKAFKAVSVPSHGRLIDADSKTFPTLHRNPSNDYMKGWNACLRSVQQQPTIIPAEEDQ